MTEMDSRAYYEKCVELAGNQGWFATYNALVEDGFDPKINWQAMYEGWVKKS